MEAKTLRCLARLHVAQGDAKKLVEPLEACGVEAIAALCEVLLGQPAEAVVRVNAALSRLQQELAACPAIETLATRWTCYQVLEALGGEHAPRAGPLLDPLYTDVLARATAVTDAADRDRLIQAIPDFRGIAAAHAQRGGQNPDH